MVQEIIVYLILIVTALHLLQQTVVFFKPAKSHGNGYSCSGGSCSNCSLKIDLNSIQPSQENHKRSKNRFIEVKKWY